MTEAIADANAGGDLAVSTQRRRAILALGLLVPAPSLGTLTAMVLVPGSPIGSAIFIACKIWLFALPAVWHLWIDRKPVSLSPAKNGGFMMGAITGIAISVAIVSAYSLFGTALLDVTVLRDKVEAMGLANPVYFALGAAYWILINSVLEEYVWRWFCVTKARQLMPKSAAVLVAALFFTLHHIIALSTYFGPVGVAICSAGVFVGGALWGWMYLRYRSIWPPYLSHAIVDVAVFGIGAWVLFA
jgi:membrane protease YdiL (CAAX protease family)